MAYYTSSRPSPSVASKAHCDAYRPIVSSPLNPVPQQRSVDALIPHHRFSLSACSPPSLALAALPSSSLFLSRRPSMSKRVCAMSLAQRLLRRKAEEAWRMYAIIHYGVDLSTRLTPLECTSRSSRTSGMYPNSTATPTSSGEPVPPNPLSPALALAAESVPPKSLSFRPKAPVTVPQPVSLSRPRKQCLPPVPYSRPAMSHPSFSPRRSQALVAPMPLFPPPKSLQRNRPEPLQPWARFSHSTPNLSLSSSPSSAASSLRSTSTPSLALGPGRSSGRSSSRSGSSSSSPQSYLKPRRFQDRLSHLTPKRLVSACSYGVAQLQGYLFTRLDRSQFSKGEVVAEGDIVDVV